MYFPGYMSIKVSGKAIDLATLTLFEALNSTIFLKINNNNRWGNFWRFPTWLPEELMGSTGTWIPDPITTSFHGKIIEVSLISFSKLPLPHETYMRPFMTKIRGAGWYWEAFRGPRLPWLISLLNLYKMKRKARKKPRNRKQNKKNSVCD